MIWDIITNLTGGLWGYVATAAGAIAVIVAAYLKGGAAARAKARAKAAEDHIETRREIDDAIENSRRSGGTWRDRLRQHRK